MYLLESFGFYGLYVSNLLGKLGLDNLDQTKRQDWSQTYTISDPLSKRPSFAPAGLSFLLSTERC